MLSKLTIKAWQGLSALFLFLALMLGAFLIKEVLDRKAIEVEFANAKTQWAEDEAKLTAAANERILENQGKERAAADLREKGIRDEYEEKLAKGRLAVASDTAARRLSDRTAQLAASCGGRPDDQTAGTGGTTAEEAGRLLAYMQRSLEERGRAIARFADDTYDNFGRCESEHDQVATDVAK